MTMSMTATIPEREALRGNVHLLPQTRHLRAVHATIRDRTTSRDDFTFHAGRVIRLLIEAGLDLLPYEDHPVGTPVGATYDGLRVAAPFCGVSIVRAGDSMEAELRAVCRSIRIGKILIQRDELTKLPRLYYSALPPDIARRHVLLLDPMLATGGTALAAIEVLLHAGVAEERIIFVNLLTVAEGLRALCDAHPSVRIVTSAIDEALNENAYMVPGIGDFGDRFFGTDA